MKLLSTSLLFFFVFGCAHRTKPPHSSIRLEYRAISIHNGQLGVGEEMAREYFVALPAGTSLISSLVFNVEEGAPISQATNEVLHVSSQASLLEDTNEIEVNTSVSVTLPNNQTTDEIKTVLHLDNGLASAIGGWAFIADKNKKSPPAVLIIMKADATHAQ